ncbi:penicillin-binding protein 2 [Patescibacteria group bacterium]|nr:penicillin-binding protein 2 [Patescibacteria group bacterium]
MKKKFGNLRFYFIFFLIVLAAGCIAVRLFYLQVLKHGFYAALAEGQHEFTKKIIPQRGEIFIQGKNNLLYPLAVNRTYQTVFLTPKEIMDKNEVASKLAPIVEIPEDKILEKMKDPEDPYESLKSKLSDEAVQKIKELKLAGVYLSSENLRWYPQENLASHISGFVGFKDNQRIGQYGVEGYYEKELAGSSGFLSSEKDALGRWFLVSDYRIQPAQDGADIYLTLDQNIQYAVEQKMKEVLEKWDSKNGCAIVMEPKTGAIRALASFPEFNPNEYNKVESMNIFLNSCVQGLYEPGSVFKPIVMAAGLDTNKISPETTYVDTGSVQIGGYVVKNSQEKTYGLSTMTEVLEKSINTGVIFVQKTIGGETFKKYIETFGFGELLGVDLSGEAGGNLKNLYEDRDINFATAAFGQGISATPLQMTAAIAAIANNGKLMKPYIVEKIVESNGEEKKTEPQEIRQVISAQAAGKLTAMLVSTVRNGYDKVKIKDYFIAGKTGTAQIPSEDKRGYSEETSHTFVGYAPAYNPKFIIFLKMEKPRGIQFASESLAPVFSDLAQYLFNYYEIPPEG